MGIVVDSSANAANCLCGECPSEPDQLKTFYCARGKSGHLVPHRGCLYEDCEVQLVYDLDETYYCEKGLAE